jgi:hypothetical protein
MPGAQIAIQAFARATFTITRGAVIRCAQLAGPKGEDMTMEITSDKFVLFTQPG